MDDIDIETARYNSIDYMIIVVGVGDSTNTEWNSGRICSLPLFPLMTTADVAKVTDAISKIQA